MKMADEMRTREKLPNVVEDAMAQDLEDWADLKKGRL
jgi:type II secretory pathway component PulL